MADRKHLCCITNKPPKHYSILVPPTRQWGIFQVYIPPSVAIEQGRRSVSLIINNCGSFTQRFAQWQNTSSFHLRPTKRWRKLGLQTDVSACELKTCCFLKRRTYKCTEWKSLTSNKAKYFKIATIKMFGYPAISSDRMTVRKIKLKFYVWMWKLDWNRLVWLITFRTTGPACLRERGLKDKKSCKNMNRHKINNYARKKQQSDTKVKRTLSDTKTVQTFGNA